MLIYSIIITSISLQLVAAFMAWHLVKVSGNKWAWKLIAAAMVLQAVRRAMVLFELANGRAHAIELQFPELIGLVIAVFQFLGIAGIESFFRLKDMSAAERREAEKQIEQDYSLLKATIESTADGLLVVDRSGKIINYNQRFVKMWNIPYSIMATHDDNQALGFVLEQLSDPNAFITKVRELYATPEAESFDLLAFKDGRSFERYSRPQYLAARPVGRVWSFRDVTERQRAEEYFRALIENSEDVVTVIDGQGVVKYQSHNYRQVWGRDPSGEIGKDLYKDVHPDDITLVADKFDYLRKNPGGMVNIQARAKREDGAWRCLEVVAKNLLADPAVGGMVINFRDITERKRAEEELILIDSLNKAANSNEDINAIITMLSKETAKLFSSRGSAVYLTTSRPDELELQNINIPAEMKALIERLIGREVPKVKTRLEAGSKYLAIMRQRSVTALNDRAQIESLIAEWARPFGLQNFVPKIMGIIGIRSIIMMPLVSNNRSIGLIELSRSAPFTAREIESFTRISNEFNLIIERKRAEDEINKLNAELEQKVAERTSQLRNTNQELEAFNYSVSHDLQAPIRNIGGFSRALLEDYMDKLDEQGKDYLRRVCAATERATELINDLLDLSKLTQAKLTNEDIDLSALARSVFNELKSAVPDRLIEFTAPDGLRAQADPQLIKIVMTNLFDNAFKFSAPHPAARIEFGTGEKEGKKFYYIRDDGVGFNPAYVNRLFTPFQRLHSKSEFPGTGIGLATVRRIILRHGGEVWAEGEEGRGAAFYFTLPG